MSSSGPPFPDEDGEYRVGDCVMERAHLMRRWVFVLAAATCFTCLECYFWMVVYSLYVQLSDSTEIDHWI